MFNLNRVSDSRLIKNEENEPIGTERVPDSPIDSWEYDLPGANIEKGRDLTVENIVDVIGEKTLDLIDRLQGNRIISSEEIPNIAKEFSDYMISELFIEESKNTGLVLDILDGSSLFDLAKIIAKNDGYRDDISTLMMEHKIKTAIAKNLQLNFS